MTNKLQLLSLQILDQLCDITLALPEKGEVLAQLFFLKIDPLYGPRGYK